MSESKKPKVKKLFQKAKQTARAPAKRITTDGAFAYGKAVKKEFWSYDNRKPHDRYVSLRQRSGNNNRVERYHNSFRARDKTMRGFKSLEGTEKFAENYRTFYNFVREHQGLGSTPSEKAGLQREEWKELLVKALS